MHVSQYLTLTDTPFTITSFVRGNCKLGVLSFDTELSYRSSSSGGCKLRGTIPGSRDEVRRRSTNTYHHKLNNHHEQTTKYYSII